MSTDERCKFNSRTSNVLNETNTLSLPEVYAATTNITRTSSVARKSKFAMTATKRAARDTGIEERVNTEHHDTSLFSAQTFPRVSLIATKYPQQSREAISRRLKESVWEIVDAITQMPANAEAPRRPLLLIEEWLNGDAAFGFTPSVVLGGLTDLLYVLSSSIRLRGDPLPSMGITDTNNCSTVKRSVVVEVQSPREEPGKHTTPHDSTVVKFPGVIPTNHDPSQHQQQIDFANIHPESFLPTLVHRSRELPSWPCRYTATPNGNPAFKEDISVGSLDASMSIPNTACRVCSVDVTPGSCSMEAVTHVGKTSTKTYTLTQNATMTEETLANENFNYQYPHYIAEALEMLLVFCEKPLILLTLDDQKILSKAVYHLFEALAQVIADVSAYFSPFSRKQVDTVSVSLASKQCSASSKVSQRLHLAALRAMQSLITQLHPQYDPAYLRSSTRTEKMKLNKSKGGVNTPIRRDCDPSLPVKFTALREFFDYLLQPQRESENEDSTQEMKQKPDRSCALDILVVYWNSLLFKSEPETQEPRDRMTQKKVHDTSKANMSKVAYGSEASTGDTQSESKVSVEEELKSVLQIFEQIFSSIKKAFESRESISQTKKGVTKKGNRSDIAQFPLKIPILTVYTLGMYVNTHRRVTSLCVDLLSLLIDIAPSATSLTLLDIPKPPQARHQRNSLDDYTMNVPFNYIFHTMLSFLTTLHSRGRIEMLNDMLLFIDVVLRYDTDSLIELQKNMWPANGNAREDKPHIRDILPPTIDAINACILLVFNAVCKDDLNSSTERRSVWKNMDATLSSFCEGVTTRGRACRTARSNGALEKDMNKKELRQLPVDLANDDASEGIFLTVQSIHLPKATVMSSQDMRCELLYLKRLGWEVLERFMEWQSTHAEIAALQKEIGLDSQLKNKGAIYEGYYLLDLCSMGFLDVLLMHINGDMDSAKDVDVCGASTTSQTVDNHKGSLSTGEDFEALQLESWELLTALINHTHCLRELFLSLKEKNFFLGAEYHGITEAPTDIFMNECRGRIHSTEKSLACDHYDYNFDDYIVSMGGISCAMRYLDVSLCGSSKSRSQQESEGAIMKPVWQCEPLFKAVLTFLAFLTQSGISGRNIAEAFLGMPHLVGIIINSLQSIRCHYNFAFKRRYDASRDSMTVRRAEEIDPDSAFFLPDAAFDTTLLLLDLLKNLGAIGEKYRDRLQEGKQTQHHLGYSEPQETFSMGLDAKPSVLCSNSTQEVLKPILIKASDPAFCSESEVLHLTLGEESGMETGENAPNETQETNAKEKEITLPSSGFSSYLNNFSDSSGVRMLLDWMQLILSPCPRNALNASGLSSTYSQQKDQSVVPPLDECLPRYGPLLASLLHVLQNFILTNSNSAEIFIGNEGLFVLLDAAESLAIASGIVGDNPVSTPENTNSTKEDTIRSRTFENSPTIIASSFTAKDSPLLNTGFGQLQIELKTGVTQCFECQAQNFIPYCKNLLGYILTIISDLLHTNVTACKHFTLWCSRRLQARDDEHVKSNTMHTGINAVQLLVSVWVYDIRENFENPRENGSEHTCIDKGNDVLSEEWNLTGEAFGEKPIAGLSLLYVFIRKKISMILRQGYIRRLVHRKEALGLLPSSICAAGTPSLTDSNHDVKGFLSPGAQERIESDAILLQYYLFVKQGRWIPRRAERDESTDHGNVTVVEDWFKSEDEKQLALKETLMWLNTKADMYTSFTMEAISLCLKEHLVLGLKVYSCLAALGFERLISTVVAKDICNRTFCQGVSDLAHSGKNLREEKESLSDTNAVCTVSTMQKTGEIPLTSAERSHIMVMASIRSLCIDELCLAMSSTANIFPTIGDTDEGCLQEYSVMHESNIEPNVGLVRPTTSDQRYLRGILPDVLKRGQEVCELINLGYNLEQTYQTQRLDRYLVTRLSKDRSYTHDKVKQSISSSKKGKEAICISDIVEKMRKQLFS